MAVSSIVVSDERWSGAVKLTRYSPEPQRGGDFDTFVAAMWLVFLRTPANPNPDLAGFFDLGDVGEVAEKNLQKSTPYSPAQLKS